MRFIILYKAGFPLANFSARSDLFPLSASILQPSKTVKIEVGKKGPTLI
jgi:hypothetical protein